MGPLWSAAAANVDSPHAMGIHMAAKVEAARSQVAKLIGCASQEIVFTSGATEANNIALLGIAKSAMSKGESRKRVVVSAMEHKSILAVCEELARMGFEVLTLPAGNDGVIDLSEAGRLVTANTLLVSTMLVNNETGMVQPVKEIAALAREVGAVIHTDAAQAAGRVPVDVFALDVDLASVSGHKMYGPGGVGALFVSATSPLRPMPITFGGGQEGGLRPGTLPGPLICGFGEAAVLASERMASDQSHSQALAKGLLDGLRQCQVRFSEIGDPSARVPGSLCLAFEGVRADDLINAVSPHVCISSGSACSSGQITASHVLAAINIPPSEIDNIIRIYCGRYNSMHEINYAAAAIAEAALRLAGPTGRVRQ